MFGKITYKNTIFFCQNPLKIKWQKLPNNAFFEVIFAKQSYSKIISKHWPLLEIVYPKDDFSR
jgi:hypothetical protein